MLPTPFGGEIIVTYRWERAWLRGIYSLVKHILLVGLEAITRNGPFQEER